MTYSRTMNSWISTEGCTWAGNTDHIEKKIKSDLVKSVLIMAQAYWRDKCSQKEFLWNKDSHATPCKKSNQVK